MMLNARAAEAFPGAVEQARRAVQEADAAFASATNGVSKVGEVGGIVWSPQLVQTLTLAVLSFGVVVLALMTFLLYRNRESGMQILRCFGVVLIVCLSAVLLVVGYSNEQLTPIVGLFGAIAGYLLGKDSGASAGGAAGIREARDKIDRQPGSGSAQSGE